MITEPLSFIFERSWRTGEVPEDWRKASVMLVFKKGRKEDLLVSKFESLPNVFMGQ